jgi:DnaJ-class molecular chaperone
MAACKKWQEPSNHFEALGVDRGSTHDEIKARWRVISRELHPDRHLKEAAKYAPRFAAVSQAWAVLGDRDCRRRYEAELDMGSAPCPACKGKGRVTKQQGFTARTSTGCATCKGTGRTEKKVRS